MAVRILPGDCRDVLKTLDAGSVQCCVTSPPYFGLRDYGHAGQIGLEASPGAYVAELVVVFREVKRVLRDDGTVWLNLGSSFATRSVESTNYVIKRDLPDAERREVLKALSAVWAGDASPESAVQGLLAGRSRKTGQLPREALRKVREAVHGPQDPCGTREREVLLPVVRPIGQPDTQASARGAGVQVVRQGAGAVSGRHAEEQVQGGVLRPGLLVQPQSERQSLSLGGRSRRPDEPGRGEVAAGRLEAGQESLSRMPCQGEVGGAPYPSVPLARGGAMAYGERDHALSVLPQKDWQERDGVCSSSGVHGVGSIGHLEGLKFRKDTIPAELLAWCEPEFAIQPKNDLGIPWRVAFALQADGWYLRSAIVWHKPNPMPESVIDRPTSAHEMVFLLAKQERYFYDAAAIAEESITRDSRTAGTSKGAKDLDGRASWRSHENRKGHDFSKRNARNVWTITPRPYKGAHFATMPPELAERCIRAGSRPGDLILDPFAGAGTTGKAADTLGRNAVLIELNPDYCELARQRAANDAPLLAEVS